MSKGNRKSNKKEIVLGVTGSIAAYKSADIIRRLQDKDFQVKVIMTGCAERFITPLTLSSLSGQRVYTDMFSGSEPWEMSHISLAREAKVIVIAPATANTIGKLAHGLADDLLSCTVLATKAKVLIAPAMNDEMYNSKAVQENCRKLKKNGMIFIEPSKGKLACGTTGIGHLAEVEDIIKAIVHLTK